MDKLPEGKAMLSKRRNLNAYVRQSSEAQERRRRRAAVAGLNIAPPSPAPLNIA
jgi:hypothetical protein